MLPFFCKKINCLRKSNYQLTKNVALCYCNTGWPHTVAFQEGWILKDKTSVEKLRLFCKTVYDFIMDIFYGYLLSQWVLSRFLRGEGGEP